MTHILAYLLFALNGFEEPHHAMNQAARDLCGQQCPPGYIWYSEWWWAEINKSDVKTVGEK